MAPGRVNFWVPQEKRSFVDRNRRKYPDPPFRKQNYLKMLRIRDAIRYYGRVMPSELRLVTYFLTDMKSTTHVSQAGAFRDRIERMVPIVEIKVPGAERTMYAVIDIGLDKSVISKGVAQSYARGEIKRSAVRRPYVNQIRWRSTREYSTDTTINLPIEVEGLNNLAKFVKRELWLKLNVTESFEDDWTVLGNDFLHRYI